MRPHSNILKKSTFADTITGTFRLGTGEREGRYTTKMKVNENKR